MSRAPRTPLLLGILAVRSVFAQEPAKAAPPPQEESQLPPEEDAALNAPKQYGFNPVQSKREVGVGMVYFRKRNYKAAAYRFQEATKWNDGNAEAWLRLGEAEEKRENIQSARAAYRRFLEVSPDAKNASEVKKKLERLK